MGGVGGEGRGRGARGVANVRSESHSGVLFETTGGVIEKSGEVLGAFG